MFHVLPLWVGAFVAPLPPLPARTGPRAALRCHASADGPAEPPELEPDLSAWRNVRHQLSRTWEGDDAGGDEGWAHTVPSPEPGCVLLAKPNVRFVNDPAKMLSVVLVLQRGQSLRLLRARPAALGSSALPGRGRPTGRTHHCLGCLS